MKWLADENFDNDILRGVRRRDAEFDVIRVQDVSEISGHDDMAVLVWGNRKRPSLTDSRSLYYDSGDAGTITAVRSMLADSTRARLASNRSGD